MYYTTWSSLQVKIVNAQTRVRQGACRGLGHWRGQFRNVHLDAPTFAASSILAVFHPLRGLALKNIANGLLLLVIIGFFHLEPQRTGEVGGVGGGWPQRTGDTGVVGGSLSQR